MSHLVPLLVLGIVPLTAVLVLMCGADGHSGCRGAAEEYTGERFILVPFDPAAASPDHLAELSDAEIDARIAALEQQFPVAADRPAENGTRFGPYGLGS